MTRKLGASQMETLKSFRPSEIIHESQGKKVEESLLRLGLLKSLGGRCYILTADGYEALGELKVAKMLRALEEKH